MRSPECKGSNKIAEALVGHKRTRCPCCEHIVAVVDGVIAKHWWSQRDMHRHLGLKRSTR